MIVQDVREDPAERLIPVKILYILIEDEVVNKVKLLSGEEKMNWLVRDMRVVWNGWIWIKSVEKEEMGSLKGSLERHLQQAIFSSSWGSNLGNIICLRIPIWFNFEIVFCEVKISFLIGFCWILQGKQPIFCTTLPSTGAVSDGLLSNCEHSAVWNDSCYTCLSYILCGK